MSTLRYQATHLPEAWPLPRFSRIVSALAATLSATIDVFAEAQDMARAAHKRYPFIEG
jgi:hypothetical protein